MPARCPLFRTCLLAVLVIAACSSESRLGSKTDESAQGTVSLNRISDPSLQAAHPIKIHASVIALVLNGIHILDNEPAASGASSPRRAFTGSEVGHLAPLISESLRRAESDQQVGFSAGQVVGVVYAYGRSLYVTLTRSGSDTARAKSSHGNASPRLVLSFVPEAAKRPDSYLDPRSRQDTLVIDYELLARLPPASVPSASAAPTSAPPQGPSAGKTEPGRDAEIEALRKELQEIKKQLAEQEAERARSQPKNTAPQK